MRIHFSLCSILYAAFLTNAATANDNSQPIPLYGSQITVHGVVLDWQEANDNGTRRYDTYTNGDDVMYTESVLDSPAVAWASASVAGMNYEGHLDNGVYGDNRRDVSETGSFSIDGYEYTSVSGSYTYEVDFEAGVLRESFEGSYTSDTGSITFYSNGDWVEEQSGSAITTTASSGNPNPSLFGLDYAFESGVSTWYVQNTPYGSINVSSWTDHYSGPNGAWLTITSTSNNDQGDSTSISGWDLGIGGFSGGYGSAYWGLNDVEWYPRDPSYFGSQIWVKLVGESDYTMLDWQSSSLDPAGNATDTYTGSRTLIVSGDLRAFNSGSANAQIQIESDTGECLGSDKSFSVSGWDIRLDPPDPTEFHTPFFTSAQSLWVNGSEYTYVHSLQDWQGIRADVYEHESVGAVTIRGWITAPDPADVTASYHAISTYGTYSAGVFAVVGLEIGTSPPPGLGPDAFWVRGEIYRKHSDQNHYVSTANAGHQITLSSANGGLTVAISLVNDLGTYTGSFAADAGGVLVILDSVHEVSISLLFANDDGTPVLSAASRPSGMPPAVMLNQGILVFAGTAADDASPASTAAYYCSATGLSTSTSVLKIRTDGTVTYTNYADSTKNGTGSYSLVTHLFQTGLENSLPMPIFAVHACLNHTGWHLPTPPSGMPASFLVGGDTWLFKGLDADGKPVYQGYYDGQQLVFGPLVEGARRVALTDPVHGSTTGSLNASRGTIRFLDDHVAYSGDFQGQRIHPSTDPAALYPIAADLDITGNVFSMGSLTGDASVAGATWHFQDIGNVATLSNALSRPTAGWLWSRAADSSLQTTRTVMELDTAHSLKLTAPTAATPGVVLRPNGISTFNGSVRVLPSGDLPMGGFHQGYKPDGNFDAGNP